MATWYVNSAAAGTGAGTSWVNATTTLAAAITLSAAGDDFNVLSTHAETLAGALTLTFKGTAAAPNRVFSCTNANSPATAADLLAGAQVTTTGANSITIQGRVYCYGVTFNSGTGTSAAGFSLGTSSASILTFDACQFKLLVTVATAALTIGGAGGTVVFNNTTVAFNGGTASNIAVTIGAFIWRNTASAVGGTQSAIANLFNPTFAAVILVDGVDLTGIASGKNIIGAAASGCIAQIVNSKITSGAIFAATPTNNATIDAVVSDSGATGYKQSRITYQGTLTASTTVFNNATDSVTPISWQVVTTANAKRQSPFECFDIVEWVAPGTYAASLIQITSATASLLNSDIWVDVEYLGNASFPISSQVSSGPATQLTTGSALAAGSWAHGSLGHDYQLAIPSFSTNLGGYVRFKVKVAKASLTVNIDPAVTVA